MSGIEPLQPGVDPSRPSSRPSLLSASEAQGAAASAEQPISLLSALQPNGARHRAGTRFSAAKKALIALATMSVAGAAALVLATNSDNAGAPDTAVVTTVPPVASTVALVPAPASAPASLVEAPMAAASALTPDNASAEPAAERQPEGPAQVETRNEGLAALPGMAAAAEAVAAQRSGASAPVVAAASAPASTPAPRPAKSRTTVAAKQPAAPATRARPEAAGEATATSRDPDAELVAAIMARLESPKAPSGRAAGSASDRAGTIASLVRDCNAMADSASALACRQRICEGYWGKAQACPKSMAPSATSAGARSGR